ncbi:MULTISPECIES: hypothetical protein [unclassified Phenylobacterium]|jgi:hypothetical protein|nr:MULTISPECIES: hypothetical protein [unclassified Phenylobacterium]
MRFTFAEEVQAPRRNPLMVWARRAFDMIVVGALLLAAAETISFLRDLAV